MSTLDNDAISKALDEAEEVVAPHAADAGKPRLFVESAAPDRTVAALRDILAKAGGLYDRGVPVRLAYDLAQAGTTIQILSPDMVVLLAHRVCRPYAIKEKGGATYEADVRLPRAFAAMYLEWLGEWQLPQLNGVATVPFLSDAGVIVTAEGFDATSGMWREHLPALGTCLPATPTREEAASALNQLRWTFRTFCFADARMIDEGGVAVVDLAEPPGMDESGLLVALLTAVCRQSLHLAPGILIRAAAMSGAGAGKGLLTRCISLIAYGREPHAVTGGVGAEELEKRIAAELMQGSPVLFLDNLNNTAFRSNLLASAITERPARVRLLGRSQMVALNASAQVVLTGNGLSVSEDLARRFIAIELDPRTEDPESRSFASDIRVEVTTRRNELLAALLTIWRWGRLCPQPAGRPLGSFETWCRWVRDPLLALGCRDPVERVGESKQRDSRRQSMAELFNIWWERHQDKPLRASLLHDDVQRLINPQGRARQFVTAQLEKMVGTRIAGLVLTAQHPTGNWGAITYAMQITEEREDHRGHRGHRTGNGPDAPYDPYASTGRNEIHARKTYAAGLMPPMTPMPSAPPEKSDLEAEPGDALPSDIEHTWEERL